MQTGCQNKWLVSQDAQRKGVVPWEVAKEMMLVPETFIDVQDRVLNLEKLTRKLCWYQIWCARQGVEPWKVAKGIRLIPEHWIGYKDWILKSLIAFKRCVEPTKLWKSLPSCEVNFRIPSTLNAFEFLCSFPWHLLDWLHLLSNPIPLVRWN